MQAPVYQKNLGLPTLLANFRPKIDDTLLKIASVKNCPRMLQFLLIFFLIKGHPFLNSNQKFKTKSQKRYTLLYIWENQSIRGSAGG